MTQLTVNEKYQIILTQDLLNHLGVVGPAKLTLELIPNQSLLLRKKDPMKA